MADGVAFVEVHTEQGELVKRFTITHQDIEKHGPSNLVRSTEEALPTHQIAREVWEAIGRG